MKALCIAFSFILSANSLAQTAVAKDQPSPADGIFLTKEEAAKILAEKQAAAEICRINSEAVVEKEKNKCVLDKGLLKNELELEKKKFDEISRLRNEQDKVLLDRIDDGGDNAYYFFGGLAIGAVISTVAIVGTIMLIKQAE
jgi:G3E family GTPase